jgi:hypothetical protein
MTAELPTASALCSCLRTETRNRIYVEVLSVESDGLFPCITIRPEGETGVVNSGYISLKQFQQSDIDK